MKLSWVISLLFLTTILFSLIFISTLSLEDSVSVSIESVSNNNSVTSGFLGQILVRLNENDASNANIYQDKLDSARSINKDVVGWITIEDFGIDYPVLYSTDNKMYLRRNIYGDYDIGGSIYLDSNYGDINSPMKLLHGHNMKDNSMFGKLPQMLDWSTLDDAPLIQYYDDLGLKTFKMISVFSVNADDESVIISEFSTLKELEELKQNYLDRSWAPVSDTPSSLEMLMLNTCWYGSTGQEHKLHCIVVACRVE